MLILMDHSVCLFYLYLKKIYQIGYTLTHSLTSPPKKFRDIYRVMSSGAQKEDSDNSKP